MEIKTLKIGDIHPYGNNPRKNDKSAAAVARSIEEFGWQQPIVVDVKYDRTKDKMRPYVKAEKDYIRKKQEAQTLRNARRKRA